MGGATESGRAFARYPTLPRKQRASRMGHPALAQGIAEVEVALGAGDVEGDLGAEGFG